MAATRLLSIGILHTHWVTSLAGDFQKKGPSTSREPSKIKMKKTWWENVGESCVYRKRGQEKVNDEDDNDDGSKT